MLGWLIGRVSALCVLGATHFLMLQYVTHNENRNPRRILNMLLGLASHLSPFLLEIMTSLQKVHQPCTSVFELLLPLWTSGEVRIPSDILLQFSGVSGLDGHLWGVAILRIRVYWDVQVCVYFSLSSWLQYDPSTGVWAYLPVPCFVFLCVVTTRSIPWVGDYGSKM